MTTAVEKAIAIEDLQKVLAEIEEPAPGTAASAKTTAQIVSIIKAFVDPEQLAKDVAWSVTDLDSAVMGQASLFVSYATQKAAAMRQYERMKAAFEILESRLDHLYREHLKKENPKATEGAIEAAVKGDPRWWAGQQRLIDAKAVYELAKDACSSFDHRKDMIVQASVDRRKEREGELRIMAAQPTPGVMAGAAQARQTADAILAGAKAA